LRNFLSVFMICFTISAVLLFFLGGIILESIWGALMFFSFLMAVFISIFINQEERIERLEERLEKIEKNQ